MFLAPASNTHPAILILPSKYWMSTKCDPDKIIREVIQALSNRSNLKLKLFLIKTSSIENLTKRVNGIKINNPAGIP